MSKALEAFNATMRKAGIKQVSGVVISRTLSNAETGVQQQLQLKNVSDTSDMMAAIKTAEEPMFAVKCVETVAGQKDTTNVKKPLSRKESVNIVRVWDGLEALPEAEIFADPAGQWIGELYLTDKEGKSVMRATKCDVDPQKTDAEMIDVVMDELGKLYSFQEGEKSLRIIVKDTIGDVRLDEKLA